MYILQKPSQYNLSSMMVPILLDSQKDISFKLMKGSEIILSETYSPTAEYHIAIKDIGKICASYLAGKMEMDGKRILCQNTLSDEFILNYNLNRDIISVLKCKALTDTPIIEFYGKRFLNIQHKKKVTSLKSDEYLTLFIQEGASLTIQYTVQKGNSLEIISRTFTPAILGSWFYTLDVSPSYLFNIHNINNCIGYKICIPNGQNIEYSLLPPVNEIHQFYYRNIFDVPETFTSTGYYVKAIEVESEIGRIDGQEEIISSIRKDTHKFNFGAIHNRSDLALISEMISSSDIYFKIGGRYKKIIIVEQKTEVPSNMDIMSEVKIDFRLSSSEENIELL